MNPHADIWQFSAYEIKTFKLTLSTCVLPPLKASISCHFNTYSHVSHISLQTLCKQTYLAKISPWKRSARALCHTGGPMSPCAFQKERHMSPGESHFQIYCLLKSVWLRGQIFDIVKGGVELHRIQIILSAIFAQWYTCGWPRCWKQVFSCICLLVSKYRQPGSVPMLITACCGIIPSWII